MSLTEHFGDHKNPISPYTRLGVDLGFCLVFNIGYEIDQHQNSLICWDRVIGGSALGMIVGAGLQVAYWEGENHARGLALKIPFK